MPKIIPLSKPLTTHAGDVSEIVLRDPIGSDFIALNRLPVTFASNGEMTQQTPDFVVAAQWIARLSGIDAILIGTLAHADFLAAVNGVNVHLSREGDTPGN